MGGGMNRLELGKRQGDLSAWGQICCRALASPNAAGAPPPRQLSPAWRDPHAPQAGTHTYVPAFVPLPLP